VRRCPIGPPSGDGAVPNERLLCFDDHRKPRATNHWWVPAVLGPAWEGGGGTGAGHTSPPPPLSDRPPHPFALFPTVFMHRLFFQSYWQRKVHFPPWATWLLPRLPPRGPLSPAPNAAGKNYVTPLPYVINVEKYGLEAAYPWILSQKKIVQVAPPPPSPSVQ